MKSTVLSVLLAAGLAAAQDTSSTTDSLVLSTVFETSTLTISSCAPTITDCPYSTEPLVTEVVTSYTTYCPVTAANNYTAPISTPSASSAGPSTVYQTSVITISSCAATVVDCPYTTSPVTTTIILSSVASGPPASVTPASAIPVDSTVPTAPTVAADTTPVATVPVAATVPSSPIDIGTGTPTSGIETGSSTASTTMLYTGAAAAGKSGVGAAGFVAGLALALL